MTGGPFYVLVSFTAFGPGFLPGVLATWFVVRRGVPRAERWTRLKGLVVGRLATALLAGVIVPLGMATAGLLGSYFGSNGASKAGLVLLALFGGWRVVVEPRWLNTLALASSWVCYFATLALAVPLERRLAAVFPSRSFEDEAPALSARGVRAAYLAQAVVALLVWWEEHVR
ncbi:MAG TPA: hypothetical protein VMI54_30345 [Polyangiaceae bacterium]|nr:hypothetical protein [Polyangiaceae bacterium]